MTNLTLGTLLRLCGFHVTVVVADSFDSCKWRFKNNKKLHWDCNLRVLYFHPMDAEEMKRFNAPLGGLFVFLYGGYERD